VTPGAVATVRAVLRAAAVAAVALALGAAAAQGSAGSLRVHRTAATPPLRTALFDPRLGPADQPTGFAMMHGAGAQYVRLVVHWIGIAPALPTAAFVPSNPTSPGYSWDALDATVNAAEAAGLTPILDIASGPLWALTQLPSDGNGGTPRASDLGAFATALATHFNGLTPGVPAEHVFQVWNEANLSLFLNPVNANVYRDMVNAVSDAVHAVNPQNLVVAGDLDPFGHPKTEKQNWYSVAPLAFMRAFLCVSKGAHPHATCQDPARFDVWAHHPYTFGGAFGHAKHHDDVELGDLPRMRALLKAGVRLHHVVSAQPVQFWVTEFGWDTKPPRPHAAPLNVAARWTAESLYQMWRSGVSLVTWFLLQDFPSPSPYQSGLYFHSTSLETAQPKPVLTAFRVPFVAYRQKKTVSIWGRDATSDRRVVTIQRRHGKHGRWRSVARIASNANGIFKTSLKLKTTKKDWLRATSAGSGSSLPFSLTRPKDPRIGPWGN
jgi:cellulase (glycosyl hydrolase family 5)